MTAAVGGITTTQVANDLIAKKECDIVYAETIKCSLIGRATLRNSFFPRHAAIDLGVIKNKLLFSCQYQIMIAK